MRTLTGFFVSSGTLFLWDIDYLFNSFLNTANKEQGPKMPPRQMYKNR